MTLFKRLIQVIQDNIVEAALVVATLLLTAWILYPAFHCEQGTIVRGLVTLECIE